ncbi:protein-tyrosine phosphatase, putative [Talaromyces stipitatus ATCC 10500]|uniref:protein-tyrosine-phosphatase n=1 Tax=Talaromyces stipitatus (strain ATCC 10500 / CBS 375.48 / QM 6759 / NRRL 1006) TaxID=441959 RepID=B8M6R3_TALSN|nr:protein-tyrosine phosphatase, putative [Talaromyces stipitatus ATCC 10500]EED20133.1 protein-tyrosine phosphatase, putative [Talaromyces stipitatus ATCC 10500]
MPVQTGPSLVYASIPSFARDFENSANYASTNSQQHSENRSLFTRSLDPTAENPISFEHRESVSSSGNSESTDSSPTTTISTFDTTSVTDTSPSSSPESPSALQLPYPKSTRIPEITERMAMYSDASASALAPLSAVVSTSRPVSPGRRARNLKNLSLNMPCHISRPAISTASVVEATSQNYSAPPSPVHRPAKTARRKPANLTIRTPASDQTTFARNINDIIPPTPGVPQRSLRHFESSPSLSMFSPTAAPLNSMQLPRPVTQDGAPLMPGSWQESPPRQSQVVSGTSLQQVTEEEDYNLDSRESTKRTEQSYPDGPIKIYDSGVYLYLEPTRDEASKFDVVINVAKEVLNPFAIETESKPDTVVSTLRRPVSLAKRLSMAEPMTAISEESFHSAFESLPESDSPTTPKVEKNSTPEYIHVPWDHNSEILDDLATLCQLVDDRINQGKSVLIHCQLGASRSASLVIAYGLYKHRDLDFNDMYSIVKGKSRWVGPNMSLIYQLTDFRSRVQRDEPIKAPNPDWFKTPHLTRAVQPDFGEEISQPEPVQPAQKQVQQVQNESALAEMIFSPLQPTFTQPFIRPFSLQKQHGSNSRGLLPRPLPLREKYPSSESLAQSNKSETRKVSHVRYPTVQMDLVMQDVPSSPSILSPRAAPFMCSSISRTLAGDLAGDGPAAFGFGQPLFDPRSPPQRQELLITRSIDEAYDQSGLCCLIFLLFGHFHSVTEHFISSSIQHTFLFIFTLAFSSAWLSMWSMAFLEFLQMTGLVWEEP